MAWLIILISPRYMSGFKGRVKTDISRWPATIYAIILLVGCLDICSSTLHVAQHPPHGPKPWLNLPINHGGVIGGMPKRCIRLALSLKMLTQMFTIELMDFLTPQLGHEFDQHLINTQNNPINQKGDK